MPSGEHGLAGDCAVCQFLAQVSAPVVLFASAVSTPVIAQVIECESAAPACVMILGWQSRAPPCLV